WRLRQGRRRDQKSRQHDERAHERASRSRSVERARPAEVPARRSARRAARSFILYGASRATRDFALCFLDRRHEPARRRRPRDTPSTEKETQDKKRRTRTPAGQAEGERRCCLTAVISSTCAPPSRNAPS